MLPVGTSIRPFWGILYTLGPQSVLPKRHRMLMGYPQHKSKTRRRIEGANYYTCTCRIFGFDNVRLNVVGSFCVKVAA
jgi:hypothetical protein